MVFCVVTLLSAALIGLFLLSISGTLAEWSEQTYSLWAQFLDAI